ncbi:MAG: hypothetical protein LBI73_01995 [Myroides sp.]|jgi:hypothetical protein|nr:hypothetical protein [Myroides sp.]
MKKRIITIGVLMMSGIAFSQVGIGTRAPHRSALLELKADAGEYRGVLIPHIPLKDLVDKSSINKGDIATSLLVYNTTENGVLTPGFYYWKGKEWVRLLNNQDIIDNIDKYPRNEVLGVEGTNLVLRDTKGHQVSTPIKDLNIVTTIKEIEKGKYEYTNEEGTKTIIDVAGSVIENITEILNTEEVSKEIYTSIAAQGQAATGEGGVSIVGGSKAVLEAMQISLKDGGVAPTKLTPGREKQLLFTDSTGKVQWVDVTDSAIQEALKNNEKVTVLDASANNGTFIYYNETAIDENGNFILDRGVKFDANTLNIVERKGEKEKGIYDFFDGHTSLATPLMTISTRAKSIIFDNNTTVVQGDNLQDVIDNIIAKIEIAQGKPADIKGEGILINGDAVLAGAVLKEVMLTIATNAITEDKIKDGAVTSYKLKDKAVTPGKIAPSAFDKYLLVTKENKVQWVPASDSVIQEVVQQNEKITVLQVNQAKGTFTYYNEEAIKADGSLDEKKAVSFDANTLKIEEKNGEKGVYVFYDGKTSVDAPIIEIDVAGSVIENITKILNTEEVTKEIYNSIAADAKELKKGDDSVFIEGGKNAVLADTKISVAPKGITTDKIAPGTDKYILVTKGTEVEWVPASDRIIQEVVEHNEKVTILKVDQEKGTFTYFNEAAFDKDGKLDETKGVAFDANTLSILDDSKGKYVFRDGTGIIATIDIQSTVVSNIDQILSNTEVQNSIYATVANKGKKVTSPNQSITIGGAGDKAVLNDLELSIATDGVTTSTIASKAVTPAKLAPGTAGQLLVTNVNGEAQWLDATDEVIKDLLKSKETITLLRDSGKGTFTYFNEAAFDKEGKLDETKGVAFDANTLAIEKDDAKGIYTFRDGKTQTGEALATIDIQRTVINNIDEILKNAEVQKSIYTTVANQGRSMISSDQSIALAGETKAVLNNVTINVASEGIKEDHIAKGAVTTAKISSAIEGVDGEDSTNAALGTVLTADGKGAVAFKTATESVEPAMKGDLVGEDKVVLVDGGKDVLFGADGKEVKISIVQGGITSAHIQNGTIQNEDIKDKTIQATKLDATGAEAGTVATVNADGTVSYQALTPAVIANKGNISVSDGISVSDNGEGKVLANVALGLVDKKVAPIKLTPGTDKFILVTKGGEAQWVAATDAIIKEAVSSNETVTILENKGKGIYTYLNEDAVKNGTAGVIIDVNSLSIDTSKPGVYVFKDLASDNPLATVDVSKDVINSIVTILGDTNVKEEVYKIVANQGKAITSTGGTLTIAGNKAALEALNIDIAAGGVKGTHIADKQVTAAKLDATGAEVGAIATVNKDGTVSYKALISPEVTNKAAALKTDGIIQVGGASEQAGTLFTEATLSIKEKGIGTTQLADNAITNGQIAAGAVTVDKIAAGATDLKRVMVTDENGVVKWGELDDIVTDAAGNLTSSDNIIAVKGTGGPENEYGQNALFKDVVLSINDKSITKDKLSSVKSTGENEADDLLLTTDGAGGFKFIPKEVVATPTGDLTSSNTIAITEGKDAVLKDVTLEVKDGAITTAKMSSQGAQANEVLTADGKGAVAYKKISDNAFEGTGANLLSDGSLSIPADNKAVLKDLTIGIAEGKVEHKHLAANAVDTTNIVAESVDTTKLKGGVAKQLLITNDGGKAEWVDAANTAIIDLVKVNETITLLEDNGNGTFTYKNENDIAKGTAGITFDANTLKITDDKKGTYVFKDGNGEIATINIQATVIQNITELLQDVKVKEEVYKVVAAQGKQVSTDASLEVVGGDKATLHPMTISLRDGGVTTAKITSKVDGANSTEGTVLTADGQGNTIFKKLSDVAVTQGKAITSTGKSLAIAGNKAALENVNIEIAPGGVKGGHIAEKTVSSDKIAANTSKGLVLTSDGLGGAEFIAVQDAIDKSGKAIKGSGAISVANGEHAALTEVTLDVVNGGIVEGKLANDAVTTDKIKNESVTVNKIQGESSFRLLGTDDSGKAQWLSAESDVVKLIVSTSETTTILRDNKDGTFTYFNEDQIDRDGQPRPNTEGVTFDANTLSIDTTIPGVFVFKDKSTKALLATIDTRAKAIVFEDNSTVGYTNVEEAILAINKKIEQLENLDIAKAPLTGKGILVNGKASEVDAVFKDVELSIADNAITTNKIANANVTPSKLQAGVAKQLLVTNAEGQAAWVSATDDIIKEIVNTQERITLLKDHGTGMFTYYNETDVDKDGNIIGKGIQFDANTLSINVVGKGRYEFFDKKDQKALAIIDVKHDVVENILEIISNVSVKEELFNVIAAQGKAVSTDGAIVVTGGDKAVLNEMSIALKNEGVTDVKVAPNAITHTKIAKNAVTSEKIGTGAVTEDKLFAGLNKANFVPVVQSDGSVKYEPVTAVVTGKMLTVDNSLKASGDLATALLKDVTLEVNEGGIVNEHIQNLAVTADKISSKVNNTAVAKGDVLAADGSGNTVFYSSKEIVNAATQGDLVGEKNVILVTGGENVLFGDEAKQTSININKGGIKGGAGGHIAANTITDLNIQNKTISAAKLTGGEAVEGSVATVGKDGVVSYQPLTSASITTKGNIQVKDGITVDNGAEKVFSDVTLGIANTSITAAKLSAGNSPVGAVATVSGNGTSVEYQLLSTNNLANKGSITTDKSLEISNDGKGKVLSDVKITVASGGITTDKLAANAVTSDKISDLAVTVDKISSQGVTAKSVLISGSENDVFWGELKDIVTNTAGDLTTDGIIVLTQGTGVNTLLADAQLSIKKNSITKEELSSADPTQASGNAALDMILVADGKGGFDFVEKEAVQAGGVDLTIGDALKFTNNTTGKNAVLAPTSIDVKEGGISTEKLAEAAVTTSKISSVGAVANAVLTAKGDGTVGYEAISETAFSGKGANLLSDTSIEVVAGNQALLKETTIAIAEKGVKTTHLEDKAVTVKKINSENSAVGAVLTVDKTGSVLFKELDEVAKTQGKAITSTGKTLAISAGNKAVLEGVNIDVAKDGITSEHLAPRQVTVDKIGTGDMGSGLMLTTDGQGGAEFKNVGEAIADVGKALKGGTGITITGGGKDHALLGDAAVNIAEGGVGEVQLSDSAVTTVKIANNNVTTAKISSKVNGANADKGQVLTADGKGNVAFLTPTTPTGELKGSLSIQVDNGKGALLQDVDIAVKADGISNEHLADNAITEGKVADGAITNKKIGENAVGKNNIIASSIEERHHETGGVSTRAIAQSAITEDKIAKDAVTEAKIAGSAVTSDKIKENAVTTTKIADANVTTAKITAGSTATVGHVLTVESGGKVAFKAPKENDIVKKDIKESNTIKATTGATGAVLEEVQLEIREQSIQYEHLAANAVDHEEIRDNAVHGRVIKAQGVGAEKISSEGATDGYVLTANGSGGVSFKKAKGGGSGFFYAPSFTVDIEGGEKGQVNVHQMYLDQFGNALSSRQGAKLNTYDYNDLDFFVTYYDKEVFEDVRIDGGGVLYYTVKINPVITANTYFNVAMQLIED